MPRDWSEPYKIILQYFRSSERGKEFGANKIGLARFLGVSQGKTQKWEKGQWPAAEDLALIAEKLGCDYKWLLTGEGDPFRPTRAWDKTQTPKPIPVIGLAACGVEGWNSVMPISTSATLPITGNMVAVIAAGESMIPAGIAPGQICYCDPEQQVLAGDAAYIRRRDGLATIKVFLGESASGPNFVGFKGWLPAGTEGRKEFFLDILESQIETLAPVVFVRRRI